jgi:hypothetical protein
MVVVGVALDQELQVELPVLLAPRQLAMRHLPGGRERRAVLSLVPAVHRRLLHPVLV